MRFVRFTAFLVLFAGITAGALVGQDKSSATKAKGTLPANWNKLGLSDEQKAKVYDIQTKYRAKIDDVKKQIAELQEKERKESIAVLTDTQRKKLKDIVESKAGIKDK